MAANRVGRRQGRGSPGGLEPGRGSPGGLEPGRGSPGRRSPGRSPGVQRRSARVTVKYNRQELQRRLDTEQWIDGRLEELYRGRGNRDGPGMDRGWTGNGPGMDRELGREPGSGPAPSRGLMEGSGSSTGDGDRGWGRGTGDGPGTGHWNRDRDRG
uniref:Protein phosphatase 1 regulatory subunit 14A n=1 Tax=Cyanoderma ruficeps TaxID=181631 RepID=A0A8C3QJ40_9PASS